MMFNPIHFISFLSCLTFQHFSENDGYSLNHFLSLVFLLFTTYSQSIFVAPHKVRQANATGFKAILIQETEKNSEFFPAGRWGF